MVLKATFPLIFLICQILLFTKILAEEEPIIDSQGETFEVAEGATIYLPCNIQNLGDFAVMWRRVGNDFLFVDAQKMTMDERMELKQDSDDEWTLVIHRVEPYDSAEYSCEVSTDPQKSIIHTVQVMVAPSVSLSSDAKFLVLKPGQMESLQCNAGGNPKPNVTWERVGSDLPSGDKMHYGEQLVFPNVTTSDSGKYRCTARNGVGQPASTDITLQVHSGNGKKNFAPWVEAPRDYVPAKVGANINVTCYYDAEPPPQVQWLYHSYVLNLNEPANRHIVHLTARRDNYTETILQIDNIQEDNFGDYSCRISNNMGTVMKDVHVSGKPGPPALVAEPEGSLQPTLTWTVQSADPVIEYQIKYRLEMQNGWQNYPLIRATKDDHIGGTEWRHSEVITVLDPASTYELQVQARNAYGWGSLARNYATYQTGASPTPAPGDTAKEVEGSSGSALSKETKGAATCQPNTTTTVLILSSLFFIIKLLRLR